MSTSHLEVGNSWRWADRVWSRLVGSVIDRPGIRRNGIRDLVGLVILLGSLMPNRRDHDSIDTTASDATEQQPHERHVMDSSETKRVLVSAGSKHGATQEIAERIGTVLSERGHDVTVSPPEAISEVSGYHAIVLGSAVYAGRWVAASKALAEAVARSEPPVPTWLFSSGPIGDPPKPEEESVDVADIVASTSARDHRVFSGKIDKSKLNFAEKAILVAVHAGDGDFRDWNEIEAWASDIADSLTS